jgi:hypothetical protein
MQGDVECPRSRRCIARGTRVAADLKSAFSVAYIPLREDTVILSKFDGQNVHIYQ